MADNEKQDIPPKETTEEQVVTPWTVKAAEGSDTIDYDKLISEGLSTDSLCLFHAENLNKFKTYTVYASTPTFILSLNAETVCGTWTFVLSAKLI